MASLNVLAESLEELIEAKPSVGRTPLADKPMASGRAKAEMFQATDVWIHLNLGLEDLRDLIKRREVTINARDNKKLKDSVNVYRVTLNYKGKGVPRM